jgi:tetratricopeptide (TPR) repeat protein
VIALTIQPKRSAGLMEQARLALTAQQNARAARQMYETVRQGDRATQLFRQAAQVDSLDPLPLHAAALLQSRLIAYAPRRDMFYLEQGVALYEAAAERDPLNYMRWRNLAIAQMYLACQTEDMQGVERAVATMRRALDLYPNNPADWAELAKMASVTGGKFADRPALLRVGIEAVDEALSRDLGWPAEDAQKFTTARREELFQMRQQLLERLHAAGAALTASSQAACK